MRATTKKNADDGMLKVSSYGLLMSFVCRECIRTSMYMVVSVFVQLCTARLFSGVVVETLSSLDAQPACIYILAEQHRRSVLGIGGVVVKNLHNCQTSV
jgi:hypothetical protein